MSRGIDLLSMPTETQLAIGARGVIEIKGLRKSWNQLNTCQGAPLYPQYAFD